MPKVNPDPTGIVLEFDAELAAIQNTNLLNEIIQAGENELRESAEKITLNMLQKAFEFGYGFGRKAAVSKEAD